MKPPIPSFGEPVPLLMSACLLLATVGSRGASPDDKRSAESPDKEARVQANSREQVTPKTPLPPIHDQPFFIGGHVRNPGRLQWTEAMTVAEAIRKAGGADEFGAMNRVLLTRNGKVRILDLTRGEGGKTPLQAYDQIEVPEKILFRK